MIMSLVVTIWGTFVILLYLLLLLIKAWSWINLLFLFPCRSTHSGEIKQNYKYYFSLFFQKLILQELFFIAIKFREFCQTGVKDRGPLFNHHKFLTKSVIIVIRIYLSVKPRIKPKPVTWLCNTDQLTGFYITRNFTGRCFGIEYSKERFEKWN